MREASVSKKFYEIDFISNDEKNITYEFSVEITLDRLLANKIYLYISNDFIYTSNGQRSTNQEKYFIFFLKKIQKNYTPHPERSISVISAAFYAKIAASFVS